MNWTALLKHVIVGMIGGYLTITSVNGLPDTSIPGKWQVVGAVMGGGLRAVQEFLSPSSYVREPTGETAKKLAG